VLFNVFLWTIVVKAKFNILSNNVLGIPKGVQKF
jgi:hypothetical protein